MLLDTTHRNNSFIDYIREDKSKYPTATSQGYYDPDNDFLVGESGGFLLNIDFIFVKTERLRVAALNYNPITERYVPYEEDSPEYLQFLHQEEKYRKYGFTANCKLLFKDIPLYNKLIRDDKEDEAEALLKPLRITGAHYNFINYGRIRALDEKTIRGGTATKSEQIARFFDSQYWVAKVKEFAKNNGFNLWIAKSRRAGLTYCEAIESANLLNLNPKFTVMHTAYLEKYITAGNSMTNMALNQLIFYETNTPFKRGVAGTLAKREITEIILGYKNKGGNISGWQSKLLSAPFFSQVDQWVGKDGELKIDELNNAPNVFEMLDVTEPVTRTGAYRTAMITGWGTGGSEDGDWQQFEMLFYDCLYGAMPFENVWDKNARHTTCGFFKPFWWGLEGEISEHLLSTIKTSPLYNDYVETYGMFIGKKAMDKDGNSDYHIAMIISDIEREEARLKNKNNENKFKIFCSQYANHPSESFSSGAINLYGSPTLNEHIDNIKHNPDYHGYRDGYVFDTGKGDVIFKTNGELYSEGYEVHPYITDVPHKNTTDTRGCVREFIPPLEVGGKVPEGLCVMVIDPVGIDKDAADVSDKHSLCSIQIWMPPNEIANNTSDLLMCTFTGRHDTMAEDDKLALLLARRYNITMGRILVEADRGETITNFRKWKELSRLMKDPTVHVDTSINAKEATKYGLNMSSISTKLRYIKQAKNFLYEPVSADEKGIPQLRLHYIYDISFLYELQKFRLKGNFDRHSAFLLYMAARATLIMRNILTMVEQEDDGTQKQFAELIRKMIYEQQEII